MITCQCTKSMGTYGSTSEYLTPIPSNKYEAGVAPLDSLPADWWNWLWQNITRNNDYTATFLNSIFSEINSVLSAAGVTPSGANTDDLKVAIERMCAKVASGEVAGSVLSSELSGRLHVNPDGTADINGLGTPSSLNTTATNVVAAINEVLAMAEGKAPIYHASTGADYGVIDSFIGTGADGCPIYTDANSGKCFGHVGLMAPNWDNKDDTSEFTMSQFYNSAPSYATHWNHRWNHLANATTPGHVYVTTGNGLSNEGGRISMAPNVRSVVFNNTTYTPDADGCINLGATGNSFPGYGTNAGCALGAASAGTSTLVARADHVHPISCQLCFNTYNRAIVNNGNTQIYSCSTNGNCGACMFMQNNGNLCLYTFYSGVCHCNLCIGQCGRYLTLCSSRLGLASGGGRLWLGDWNMCGVNVYSAIGGMYSGDPVLLTIRACCSILCIRQGLWCFYTTQLGRTVSGTDVYGAGAFLVGCTGCGIDKLVLDLLTMGSVVSIRGRCVYSTGNICACTCIQCAYTYGICGQIMVYW